MKGQRRQSFVLLLTSLALLIALVGGIWSSANAFVVPTFSIVSVQVDQTVTIQTANFPANDTFNVLMNVIHTQGVGGTQVTTVNSGSGGVLNFTFNIPANLKGQRQIAIRLESPTSGYFSYNWFWNNPSGIPNTGATVTPGPSPTPFTIPTFSIQSVAADSTVTIKTANFPANDTFDVLMNWMGTRGVGGTKVTSINSGSGGTLTMTFNIPAAYQGQRQIAIRLQSPTSGYFAYNWFWNNTTGGIPGTGVTATPGPSLPPGTIPTITILSVVKDTNVTFQTNNYPANDNYVVLMNWMGTRGVGGTQVGTFSSGSGGTLTQTVSIPAAYQGQRQIAIRVYSPTSGFYSYNWFWNNTAP